MKYFLLFLLALCACGKPSSSPTASANSGVANWVSNDGAYSLRLIDGGKAELVGVCGMTFDSWTMAGGIISLAGISTPPTGTACAGYATGPSVSLTISYRDQVANCAVFNYGTTQAWCRK